MRNEDSGRGARIEEKSKKLFSRPSKPKKPIRRRSPLKKQFELEPPLAPRTEREKKGFSSRNEKV